VPAHPRYLLPAVRKIAPVFQVDDKKRNCKGGVYPIPDFYSALIKESKMYKNYLPAPWSKFDNLPNTSGIKKKWETIEETF